MKKFILKYAFLAVVFALVFTPVKANATPNLALFSFIIPFFPAGGTITMSMNHESKSLTDGTSVDLRINSVFTNAAVSFREWQKPVVGWRGNYYRRDVTGYFGIGFFDYINFQIGTSHSSGSRFRIIGTLVPNDTYGLGIADPVSGRMVEGFSCHKEPCPRIAITPFVEFPMNKNSSGNVYGVGIGVYY